MMLSQLYLAVMTARLLACLPACVTSSDFLGLDLTMVRFLCVHQMMEDFVAICNLSDHTSICVHETLRLLLN